MRSRPLLRHRRGFRRAQRPQAAPAIPDARSIRYGSRRAGTHARWCRSPAPQAPRWCGALCRRRSLAAQRPSDAASASSLCTDGSEAPKIMQPRLSRMHSFALSTTSFGICSNVSAAQNSASRAVAPGDNPAGGAWLSSWADGGSCSSRLTSWLTSLAQMQIGECRLQFLIPGVEKALGACGCRRNRRPSDIA